MSEEALKSDVDTESPNEGLTNLVIQSILAISTSSNHLQDERVSAGRCGNVSQRSAEMRDLLNREEEKT